jgi:hypothetical protein
MDGRRLIGRDAGQDDGLAVVGIAGARVAVPSCLELAGVRVEGYAEAGPAVPLVRETDWASYFDLKNPGDG